MGPVRRDTRGEDHSNRETVAPPTMIEGTCMWPRTHRFVSSCCPHGPLGSMGDVQDLPRDLGKRFAAILILASCCCTSDSLSHRDFVPLIILLEGDRMLRRQDVGKSSQTLW